LATVLAAVLYLQFGGMRSAAGRTAPMPAAQADADRSPSADADKQEQESETDTHAARRPVAGAAWKPPDLASVIAYDPFALPARFPQPSLRGSKPATTSENVKHDTDVANRALEQMQQQLDQMRQMGVQVILNGQDQYVALIGDQTIRVGDEINGFTVTEITPAGVRVERKIDK
jgi:hypothetical protein